MTIAWAIRRQKATAMRVGCQENRSLPGTAVYTTTAVSPAVSRWNTIATNPGNLGRMVRFLVNTGSTFSFVNT